MRQSIEPQPQVQGQVGFYVEVVIAVKAVIVVDPVLACQVLQLREVRSVPQQEIDIRVAGEGAGVELRRSVGVVLQLLILVVVQPAESELQLVTAFGPGKVIAILEAFIPVLPREVTGTPVHVERGTLEINLGHAAHEVVADREEARGRIAAIGTPTAGISEAAAVLPRNWGEGNFVTAVEKG